MKVKVSLRFRGREMAHKEFGFQTVEKFIKEVSAYGHPDSAPKLIGKGITVMLSPLPRNKRGKNPHQHPDGEGSSPKRPEQNRQPEPAPAGKAPSAPPGSFANNPFAALDVKVNE